MTNNRAPASPAQALHPYSPVRGTGTGLFFVSGQLGLADGGIVPGGIAVETPQALAGPRPARTCIAVAELPYRARVELDAIAARTGT